MSKIMKDKSRLGLIIQREYMSIVGRKSFIVMTILIPLLSVACMGLPLLLSTINSGDQQTVGIIDESHNYVKAITDNEDYRFEDITPVGSAGMKEFFEKTENMYAVVVIPADVDSTLKMATYSDKSIKSSLLRHVESCMAKAVSDTRVKSFNVPGLQDMIDKCNVEVNVASIQWNAEGGEAESSAMIASIMGMALALLTYMFVLMYGAMIMNSVVEEKTNRIVEVIVSSCHPIELMLGKIIGVGLVGLTQIAIWVIFMAIASMALGLGSAAFVGVPDAAGAVPVATDGDMGRILGMLMSINYVQIIVCFVLYFIGGYMLYASLFAAFGSAVDQPSDASQFTTPIMMIIVFALWAGIACLENPDGNLAYWCSLIPLSSPIVMMVRLPYDVPVWELVLSIGLLLVTAFGITVLSARIYRTGILMYGKKSTIKDIFKWMK